MEQNSDAAQLETIKNLCTGEKCEIDPKVLFTEAVCPGTFCISPFSPKNYRFDAQCPCPCPMSEVHLPNFTEK